MGGDTFVAAGLFNSVLFFFFKWEQRNGDGGFNGSEDKKGFF